VNIEVWSDIICPWCGLGLHRLDANGVPFFVIDRAVGVSGAQPTEVFERAIALAAAGPAVAQRA